MNGRYLVDSISETMKNHKEKLTPPSPKDTRHRESEAISTQVTQMITSISDTKTDKHVVA